MTAFGLTARQSAALGAIVAYIDQHGQPPSVHDIAMALGMKGSSRVHHLLVRLKERGCIDWMPRRARSIRLLASRSYTLPSALQAKLDRFLVSTGDDAAGFVIDAVALHLDSFERVADEEVVRTMVASS